MNSADDRDVANLRARLEEIDGVDHVVLDTPQQQICLILRGAAAADYVEETARALAQGYTVRVTYPPERRDRQRVRVVSLHRETQPDQQVQFSVTLEWARREATASETGEKGEGVELRTVAAAALKAVEDFVPGGLGVRLAGVKQVRAFDADLVVVSLYRPDSQPRNLVGAVVVTGDSPRAAVNAVLSALNRLLGNYLVLP
jgi:hypothetical protein